MSKLSNDQVNFILNLNASGLQQELIKSAGEIKKFNKENKSLQKELKEAEKFLVKTASAMEKLEKSGKQNSKEYEELKNTYASCSQEVADYNSKIKSNNDEIARNTEIQKTALSSLKNQDMTMSQLKNQASALQKQLDHTSASANPEEYKNLQKQLDETKSAMDVLATKGKGTIATLAAMPNPVGEATRAVIGFGNGLKQLAMNPIGAVLMAIVALFFVFKKAINSSEEATNKFNQILAPFRALMDSILNVVQKVVGAIADGIAWLMKLGGSILSLIPGMDKVIQKSNDAVQLEKDKQQLAKDERKMLVENAKTQNEVSELRAKANNKEQYSAEERLRFMDEAIALEQHQMEVNKKLAEEKLRIAKIEASRAKNKKEVEEQLAQLEAEVYRAETDYNNKSRELLEKKNSFRMEIATQTKEAAKKALEEQKKQLELVTAKMEQEKQRRILIVRRENSNIISNEADKSIRLLEVERKFTEDLLVELRSRLAKIEDETLRKDISNQIIAAETQLFEQQRSIDEQRISSVKETHAKQLNVLDTAYNAQKSVLQVKLNEMKVSQEEYDTAILYLDEQLSQDRMNLAAVALEKMNSIELSNADLRVSAIKEANNLFIAADNEANIKRTELQKTAITSLIEFKKSFGIVTESDAQALELSMLEQAYMARKELMEKEGISTIELTAAYEQAKTNMILSFENQRFSLRQQLGIATWNEEYTNRMNNLKNLLENEAITQEEYDKAVFAAKTDRAKQFYDTFSGMASGAVQALQQAEIDSVDAKYDAQIAAAGDNAEEVERLENEKAQKKLDIEKKYADVNFAIKVSEIVANTAVAIMQGFAQLGPIGGAIAAALMTATGAAQIISANAERKKVKNMTLNSGGGSSKVQERVVTGKESGGYIYVEREQDGKKFRAKNRGKAKGYIPDPSILVSENGEEFVASAESVKNPTIKPILDIIDLAQQQGNSGQINLPALLSQGYSHGGYVSEAVVQNLPPAPGNESYAFINQKIFEEICQLLKDLKENGVKAPIVLSELQKKIALMEESENYAKKE